MQVHPIFVLSIVDTLLSLLWISGSIVWLEGGAGGQSHSRVGCFTITLMTVVAKVWCPPTNVNGTKFPDSSVRGHECDPHLCSTGILQHQAENC